MMVVIIAEVRTTETCLAPGAGMPPVQSKTRVRDRS